ncbi:MAG TPA: hypothetical protein VIV06_11110, partial [Candidatus Limnocylindrales bacterium]
PWWQSWGVDAAQSARPLPGDDLVPNATATDTRVLEIEGSPAAVWPWLLQMGFGRAGWYSYDAVDMKGRSLREIDPALQSIAVGDVVPTHPGGGFIVRLIEPEHALVLYSDADLVAAQSAAAHAAGADALPGSLKATGALLDAGSLPEFAASWAFVVDPLEGGRSRFTERFRIHIGADASPLGRVVNPVLGFGLFVMMRRQMLGIRERVEASRP